MKERRLVIAMDCDDLLLPGVYTMLKFYKKKYNFEVNPARFYDGTPEDWGVGGDLELQKRIEMYYKRRKTARDLITPFPEAVEKVGKWAAKNHELHLLTARSHFVEPVTKKMVDLHFNGLFKSIIHTNGFGAGPRATKGEVCRDLNADLLIDDHIHHCENALDNGVPNGIVFGDYEWNQSSKLRKGLVRCINWHYTDIEVDRIAAA